MKKALFAVCVAASLAGTNAEARDTKHLLPIADAINSPQGKNALGTDIKLYFAGEEAPKAAKTLGSFVTNKKTNAVLKSDETACKWVLLSALKELQERARKEGGNAVVDIESFYKQEPYRSTDKYECHAGSTIAGVALRGTVIER
jgi:hypothetical protein